MDSREEVVFAVVEDVVVHCHSRRDKLYYTALYKFLGLFGVFELLADGHAFAGADEFGEIGVEGVVGKSGEFDILRRAVGAACESDAEDLGCRNGIVGKSFVEVSHAEQQHCVGMFLLHLGILLHQRSFDNLLCHCSAVGLFVVRGDFALTGHDSEIGVCADYGSGESDSNPVAHRGRRPEQKRGCNAEHNRAHALEPEQAFQTHVLAFVRREQRSCEH